MATPRDFLDDDYQAGQQAVMPRDFLDDGQYESLGQAAAYAIPRIGEDILNAGYQGIQNIPEYLQKAKTEIPGFVNPKNWLMHHIDRGGQTLAGLLELGQNINNAPRNFAQYAANRLHLIPQEFANKFPQAPNLDQDIERYIGQPKNPGDALSRGLARNADFLVGGNALAKAMPYLTKRGALKNLKKGQRLAAERDIGTLNVDPELIKDAQQYLPNNLAERNMVEGSHYGDYDSLFQLQSDLGKISSARAGKLSKIFSPETNLKGQAGLKSRNSLLNAFHKNLQDMGHSDISDLLREGQNDYRRYINFRKYPRTLGLAAAAYATPKNSLTDLIKQLYNAK
jgi:hypothetical protein